MNRLPRSLCAVAAIAAVGWADARGQSPPPDHQTSAILLDNGHLIHGQIVDEGEQVLIRLGPGSQLRLPRRRIRAVAPSPSDLFQMQHRQLPAGDVKRRIDLARWCIRNDIRADAGQVVVELIALAPRDPQVAALERQLRQSLAKPESPRPPSTESSTSSDAATLPLQDTAPGVEALTRDQLAAFTQHVQPILLNHCSAAGCHGVLAKSEFQLLRPPKGRRLTQRMTSQNLASAMKFVDADQPPESPLLLAATSSHADRAAPILDGPRMAATRKLLADWLISMQSGDSPTAVAAPRGEAASPLLQRLASEPNENRQAAHDDEPAAASPSAMNLPPRTQPLDPFDPGPFNRRYFPERMKPRSPFDPEEDDQSPPSVNDPPSSALRNATLLESKPESLPRSAGGSH